MPSASDLVRLDLRPDGVAHIELNRPQVSNAVDLPTAQAFSVIVDQVAGDDAVSAVLLTGAGKRFCAGGDVASFVAADDRSGYLQELAGELDGALQRLAALEVPVVGAVHGAVAGAGLAVMLSCDVIVAGAGTRFVAAYSAIGLTPDCGLSYLLPRAIGQVRALDLLLTGRALSAKEALDWGLVTQVVDDADVASAAAELAALLAAGPVHALGQAKRLTRGAWETTRAAAGAEEARVIAAAAQDPASERLIEAFSSR